MWGSDGTTSGTVEPAAVNPDEMISFAGQLYFAADDLWTSDGTLPGTSVVSSGITLDFSPELTDSGGTLFFEAADTGFDRELWKFDTTAGISLVKDSNCGGTTERKQELNCLSTSTRVLRVRRPMALPSRTAIYFSARMIPVAWRFGKPTAQKLVPRSSAARPPSRPN